MKNSGLFILFLAILLNSKNLYAQPSRLGGWTTVTMTYKASDKFSYYIEMQERSQGVVKDFYYHEFKGGFSYTKPGKFTALLGMGDYRTYSNTGTFKGRLIREFRIWEQLALVTNIEPLRIDHRYRIEQRWQNGVYKNRFRYRFNPVLPLNNKKIIPKTVYLTMFDEVFFTSKPPYFERNRFFAGAGYQFSKMFALQGGLIRQLDYKKVDDGFTKNYLHLNLLFFFDKNSLFAPRHPSTLD